jgi:hypothetical protein
LSRSPTRSSGGRPRGPATPPRRVRPTNRAAVSTARATGWATPTHSRIGGGSGSLSLASAHELTGGGELYAQGFGDVAKGFYQPAGCLTVTDDLTAKKATYVFSDCTGPWGLVHIKGTVTVGYSSSAGNQLTLTYSAKGLSLNNATIDWDATANTTANGLARDMVWDGHFTGTTGNGRSFQRTNHKEYKWTAGQQCLTVNGSSDGTVTGHELKIDVVSFSVCKGGCPEAGSEIKVSDVSTNKVYDVKWNAGNATYTGPEGRTVTYTPLCAR